MVRARGSYPRRRGFKSPLRHIPMLRAFAVAAATLAVAALSPARAVGREDARPSVEGTPAPAEAKAASPFDNVTELKKKVAAGAYGADELATLLAGGNTEGRYADVSEVAEVALGTPASVRAADEAARAAAARAEARRSGKEGAGDEGRRTEYEEGVALYKSNARIWNEAGVAYYFQDRAGDARACFNAAIGLDAGYDDPHVNLGMIYRRKGRYEQALSEYDAALALGPTKPTTWYNRGVVLLRLGRLQDAVAAFETATKLEPKYRPPTKRLALLWYDLGDYKTAYTYAEKLDYLVKADPTATTAERQAAQEILTLCENRLEGKKAQPTLTVEGTAAPEAAPPPAGGKAGAAEIKGKNR